MYKYLKRITDFVIALVALVVLFVPLLVVAILMGAIQDLVVPLHVCGAEKQRTGVGGKWYAVDNHTGRLTNWVSRELAKLQKGE